MRLDPTLVKIARSIFDTQVPASIIRRNQLKIAVIIYYPSLRALPKGKKRIGSKVSEL